MFYCYDLVVHWVIMPKASVDVTNILNTYISQLPRAQTTHVGRVRGINLDPDHLIIIIIIIIIIILY